MLFLVGQGFPGHCHYSTHEETSPAFLIKPLFQVLIIHLGDFAFPEQPLPNNGAGAFETGEGRSSGDLLSLMLAPGAPTGISEWGGGFTMAFPRLLSCHHLRRAPASLSPSATALSSPPTLCRIGKFLEKVSEKKSKAHQSSGRVRRRLQSHFSVSCRPRRRPARHFQWL